MEVEKGRKYLGSDDGRWLLMRKLQRAEREKRRRRRLNLVGTVS